MSSADSSIEKPVVGYIVIALSLLAGMIAANAFGQTGTRISRIATSPQTVVETSEPSTRILVPHRRWILGVRADATDTGYLVRSVEINSAANRIGLERGDRIIAVGGHQIGFVNGRCAHLSRMLDQTGGENGHVELLIQNRRNQRLVTVHATLRAPLQHLGH